MKKWMPFLAMPLLILTSAALAGEAGKLKLSVLCDDSVVADKFMTEHGVSILVTLPNGHRWLMDTGTTNVYLENAAILGESLKDLTGIFITHGHDDHGGGLMFYPRLGGEPPVYGHPNIWAKQFEIKKGEPVRDCGIPYHARIEGGPHFKPLNHVNRMDDDMVFLTDIPREPGSYCPVQGKFFNEEGTGPWPGVDDATLAIRTPKGVVVVFGCAHAGYVNILKAVLKEFPGEKILSVVGGLHLKGAGDEVFAQAADFTDSVKADGFTFYGGHCTGKDAIAYFKARFGEDAVKSLGAGRVIEF